MAALLCEIVKRMTMVVSMNSKQMILAMLLITMKWVTSKPFLDYNITLVQQLYRQLGNNVCVILGIFA